MADLNTNPPGRAPNVFIQPGGTNYRTGSHMINVPVAGQHPVQVPLLSMKPSPVPVQNVPLRTDHKP